MMEDRRDGNAPDRTTFLLGTVVLCAWFENSDSSFFWCNDNSTELVTTTNQTATDWFDLIWLIPYNDSKEERLESIHTHRERERERERSTERDRRTTTRRIIIRTTTTTTKTINNTIIVIKIKTRRRCIPPPPRPPIQWKNLNVFGIDKQTVQQ